MNKLIPVLLLMLVLCTPDARAQPVQAVDRVVAVVNNEAITFRELSLKADRYERQARRQNQQVPARDVFLKQVLEQMIIERSLMQMAREQGIRVEEPQLDRAVEQFARDNRVSVADLRSRLEREGTPFAVFREELRAEIVRARLREREVDARIQISEGDIDAFIASQGAVAAGEAEYHLAQILLPVSGNAKAEDIERQRLRGEELIKQINRGVDFARLAASFSAGNDAANGGSMGFRTAERLPQLFAEEAAKLNVGAISGLIRSPAGFHILKLLGKRNTGGKGLDLQDVTQTRVRHILIRPSELVSEAEAMRRLTDAKERIEKGVAKFEDLARQYSADGSASRGGEIGWILPGDTVPEFERAMDALQPGKISEPFRTAFGLHIVQVLERKTEPPSSDRQRAMARAALRERRMEEAFDSWIRQVRDSAYVEYRYED